MCINIIFDLIRVKITLTAVKLLVLLLKFFNLFKLEILQQKIKINFKV